MTLERLQEIFKGDNHLKNYEGDNALLGLNIITRYLPKRGVEDADHDIIYSVDVEELLDAGLTEEDAIELRNLNWMIDEDFNCFTCFV